MVVRKILLACLAAAQRRWYETRWDEAKRFTECRMPSAFAHHLTLTTPFLTCLILSCCLCHGPYMSRWCCKRHWNVVFGVPMPLSSSAACACMLVARCAPDSFFFCCFAGFVEGFGWHKSLVLGVWGPAQAQPSEWLSTAHPNGRSAAPHWWNSTSLQTWSTGRNCMA